MFKTIFLSIVTILVVGLASGTAFSEHMYFDFDGSGLYKYENESWTRISTGNADDDGLVIVPRLVGDDTWYQDLYGDFGSSGIYRYFDNGTTWVWDQINTANPDQMVAVYGILYGDFGDSGIYEYDVEEDLWTQITSNDPENMYSYGGLLYVDFGPAAEDGLWIFDGATWTEINTGSPSTIIGG